MGVSNETSMILLVLCCFQVITVMHSTSLTVVNNCNMMVWPAILSRAGTLPVSNTGLTLQPGESAVVEVSSTWSGGIIGRSICSEDSKGVLYCRTGVDCGSSTVQCHDGGNVSLTGTVAKFALNGGVGMDLFEVSVVDGFNLPVTIEPEGGNCMATGCVMDLNTQCPSELKMMIEDKVVGCKSPCQAYGDPLSCCTGPYSSPHTCMPTSYALSFKTVCPQARVFVYDQISTWSFSCLPTNYIINFCSSSSTSWTGLRNGKHRRKKANLRAILHSLVKISKDVGIVLGSILTLVRLVNIIIAFLSRRGPGRALS